jgi:hypothetical protein
MAREGGCQGRARRGLGKRRRLVAGTSIPASGLSSAISRGLSVRMRRTVRGIRAVAGSQPRSRKTERIQQPRVRRAALMRGDCSSRGKTAGRIVEPLVPVAETPGPEAGAGIFIPGAWVFEAEAAVRIVKTSVPVTETPASKAGAGVFISGTGVSKTGTALCIVKTPVAVAETPVPEAGAGIFIPGTRVSEAGAAVPATRAAVSEAGTRVSVASLRAPDVPDEGLPDAGMRSEPPVPAPGLNPLRRVTYTLVIVALVIGHM